MATQQDILVQSEKDNVTGYQTTVTTIQLGTNELYLLSGIPIVHVYFERGPAAMVEKNETMHIYITLLSSNSQILNICHMINFPYFSAHISNPPLPCSIK